MQSGRPVSARQQSGQLDRHGVKMAGHARDFIHHIPHDPKRCPFGIGAGRFARQNGMAKQICTAFFGNIMLGEHRRDIVPHRMHILTLRTSPARIKARHHFL